MRSDTKKRITKQYNSINRRTIYKTKKALNFTLEDVFNLAEKEGYEERADSYVYKSGKYFPRLTKVDKHGSNDIDNFRFITKIELKEATKNNNCMTCKECGCVKPLEDFNEIKSAYRGVSYTCLSCSRRISEERNMLLIANGLEPNPGK